MRTGLRTFREDFSIFFLDRQNEFVISFGQEFGPWERSKIFQVGVTIQSEQAANCTTIGRYSVACLMLQIHTQE